MTSSWYLYVNSACTCTRTRSGVLNETVSSLRLCAAPQLLSAASSESAVQHALIQFVQAGASESVVLEEGKEGLETDGDGSIVLLPPGCATGTQSTVQSHMLNSCHQRPRSPQVQERLGFYQLQGPIGAHAAKRRPRTPACTHIQRNSPVARKRLRADECV